MLIVVVVVVAAAVVVGLGIVGIAEGVAEHLRDKRVPLWFCKRRRRRGFCEKIRGFLF